MYPPLCFTIPYTVASPSPVPLPTSFVVKNGSNMWAWTSGVIPAPVSLTASIACGPAGASGWAATKASSSSTFAVSSRSRPPCGIASRALTARLTTICSIWAGSAVTRPRSGSSAVTSSMCSPISRWSIWTTPATTWLRSSTLGWSICLRLKASSWRVRAAARSAVFLISSTSRRSGSSAGRRRSMSSLRPVTTVSRLLKSWAMPPASRPTASIFCDCRSCSSCSRTASSARVRSVMSSPVIWIACSPSQTTDDSRTSAQISAPSFLRAWSSYRVGAGSPRSRAAVYPSIRAISCGALEQRAVALLARAQRPLRPRTLGHVAVDHLPADDLPVRVAHRREPALDDRLAAVLVDHDDLDGRRDLLPRERPARALGQARGGVRAGQLGEVPADQLLTGVAQQPRHFGIHAGDRAVEREGRDRVVGVLEETPVAPLALALAGVEPGVLDGDRGAVGEVEQHLLVAVGERARHAIGDVEHAQHAVLHLDRDDHRRDDGVPSDGAHVLLAERRVGRVVVRPAGATRQEHTPAQSLARLG